ncbi:MAG TPA: sodium:solute symporter family protein [Rubrobacteraceae bacterium]|nr:sodium:solute symporter family protein [Rubrobacteraceae bacterium]
MIVFGVAFFIFLQVAIGLQFVRRVRGSSTNFIVAGRGLILPFAAAALMAQAVDSNATLGNTDLSAQFGFWAGASLPIGLALCLFLTGLFFAKPMNRMGLLTLPDFYRRKYGRTVEMLAAPIMVLSFCILLAGNLVAGGYLFQAFLGTSFLVGVLIIAAVMLLYTLPGGLLSVVYTDLLQATLAFLGAVALLVFVAMNYGISIPDGMGPFDFEQLTDPKVGAYINWATLIALGLGDIVALDFMERVFAAESPRTARRACYVGALGTLIIGIPFSIVALSAGSIFKELGVKPDGPVLFALLQDTAPAVIVVIVLSGVVAASLSTGTGAILAMSSVCARNILGIRPGEGAGRDRLLLITRIGMIPILLFAVIIALRVPQTGILLTLAFDVTLAGLLVPFALGIYWSKSNAPAALVAIVAGSVTRLVLFVLTPTTYGVENTLLYIPNKIFSASFDGIPTILSALVGLAAFVGVALATQKSHEPVTLDLHSREPEPAVAEG